MKGSLVNSLGYRREFDSDEFPSVNARAIEIEVRRRIQYVSLISATERPVEQNEWTRIERKAGCVALDGQNEGEVRDNKVLCSLKYPSHLQYLLVRSGINTSY